MRPGAGGQQVVLSRAAAADGRAADLHRRRDIMGEFANSRLTAALAIAGTAIVLALNLVLIAETFA